MSNDIKQRSKQIFSLFKRKSDFDKMKPLEILREIENSNYISEGKYGEKELRYINKMICNYFALKSILKKNRLEGLLKEIKNLNESNPSEVIGIIKGLNMIYNNFDCSPNSGVIDDIIKYLNDDNVTGFDKFKKKLKDKV